MSEHTQKVIPKSLLRVYKTAADQNTKKKRKEGKSDCSDGLYCLMTTVFPKRSTQSHCRQNAQCMCVCFRGTQLIQCTSVQWQNPVNSGSLPSAPFCGDPLYHMLGTPGFPSTIMSTL